MTDSAALTDAAASDEASAPTGWLDGVRLVDQHCHGVARGELDRAIFERFLTESRDPAPPGTTWFDTQLGLAVRRWCAAPLGLAPYPEPDAYLRRRAELGAAEVTARLLGAAGIGHFLVDTGYGGGPDMLSPADLAAAASTENGAAAAHRVIRLEAVAEQVAAAGRTAGSFAADFAAALADAAAGAVALKSVLAYRYGLDIDPAPPAAAEVRNAAGRWLAAGAGRLTEPVLLRQMLWAGVSAAVERRLPIQLHTGFGDPDLRLPRTDPALLTDFLRAVRPLGVDVVLLHGYPYQRQAGYLANVFPHVYADVGLTLNHVGARAGALIAEALELTPFHKLLFSTDAFGLPELYCAGAALFRDGLGRTLRAWVMEGSWAEPDARRVARMIGAGNAARLYRLDRGADEE